MASGPTLIGLFGTFLVILAVLQIVFPRREGFVTPGRPGSKCNFGGDCFGGKCVNNVCH